MPPERTLYLIDGHAQFFRAYHAIRTAMTSPVTKEPTNMSYGFASMLLKLVRDYTPDYLVVVIDAAGDRETYRSELYPEYKANRPPVPDDFRPQVTRCLEVLDRMAVPVLAEPRVEADDVIATMVKRLRRDHPDVAIRIVSKDKDLTQLIGDGVELLDVYKDVTVQPGDVFKTEGVEPSQVVDILALMGDSVDNVPGVPGIGPKTAAKLIMEYGSIENLYDHLNEIKGKRHENLAAARDLVLLSRDLVVLKDDVEVEFKLDDAIFDPAAIAVEPVLALFRELGFNRQQDELKRLIARSAPSALAAGKARALSSSATGGSATGGDGFADSLFGDLEDKPAAPSDPGLYRTVTTEDELTAVLARARAAGEITIDTETDGLAVRAARLCGISIAIEPRDAVYVPVLSPEPDTHLDLNAVRRLIGPVLADESILTIGHNLKFDVNILRAHGMTVRGPMFDTMVASYVLDAARSSHRLDVLALALLGHTCTPLTDLIGTGRHQRGFDTVPLTQAGPYAAEDADMARRLYDVLRAALAEEQLLELYDAVELPLVGVLAEMEFNGIRVDRDELDVQRETLETEAANLRRRILENAPHPFNPDSPKQLAAALFNAPEQDPPGLGLKVLKRGKTGPSTDVEVLEKIAADPDLDTELPGLIVEYRHLTKLVNTYLIALRESINAETGRVHASFHQTVTATGRLSSSDPNLQNIPIRTETGREVRKAFVAEPGQLLVTADYSQIELRLLAHLSEDAGLIRAFHDGGRHPHDRGRSGLRCRSGGCDAGAALERKDGQLRDRLRDYPVWPCPPARQRYVGQGSRGDH